ncbi:MAG: hypothetical protein FWD45_07115, partial [Coriobacteriia bacterium]|nr:hypothetical protein [Coriobacteriia bacterium]
MTDSNAQPSEQNESDSNTDSHEYAHSEPTKQAESMNQRVNDTDLQPTIGVPAEAPPVVGALQTYAQSTAQTTTAHQQSQTAPESNPVVASTSSDPSLSQPQYPAPQAAPVPTAVGSTAARNYPAPQTGPVGSNYPAPQTTPVPQPAQVPAPGAAGYPSPTTRPYPVQPNRPYYEPDPASTQQPAPGWLPQVVPGQNRRRRTSAISTVIMILVALLFGFVIG